MCKPCTNCLAKPRKNSKLTLRVPNDFDDGVVFSRSHLCADFFLLLLHVILFNCKFAYSNQQHNKKICSHQLVALLLRCSCLCTHLPLVLLFLSSSHTHFSQPIFTLIRGICFLGENHQIRQSSADFICMSSQLQTHTSI